MPDDAPKVVYTSRAPKPMGQYSQAVMAHGFAFLSGQIPLDPSTGEIVKGDIPEQTTRVLDNLKAVLEACGSSMEKVVKTTVYLQSMDEFPRMNEIYGRYFPVNPPARATIEAARLPRGVRVEIDCIAVVS
jgi:2-iminobutanoate/2-iminopropanoate deaminase